MKHIVFDGAQWFAGTFYCTKIMSQNRVEDVTLESEQNAIITKEHVRADRNSIAKQCETCKLSKYDSHPQHGEMPLTPIPTYPGQIFHIDKKI